MIYFPMFGSSFSFSVTNPPSINISSHNSIEKFVSVFCQAENLNLFCSESSSNDVFNHIKIDWEKPYDVTRDIRLELKLSGWSVYFSFLFPQLEPNYHCAILLDEY